MKAVEIFMIRKSFSRNSSEKIRQEAENLVNEKHYQGYRVINVDFDVADNAGYIYALYFDETPKHLLICHAKHSLSIFKMNSIKLLFSLLIHSKHLFYL